MTNGNTESPIRILMVDDQISNLLALEDILEGIDAQLVKATSAREALLVMISKSIDCVLLDVSMPEMDGFEFLKTLSNAPAHAKIPVIMVTGKIFSENETLRAYRYGAVDFLFKPLDPETVYRKVSFIVQQAWRIKSIERMETKLDSLDLDVIRPLQALAHEEQGTSPQFALSDVTNKLQLLHEEWKKFRNE